MKNSSTHLMKTIADGKRKYMHRRPKSALFFLALLVVNIISACCLFYYTIIADQAEPEAAREKGEEDKEKFPQLQSRQVVQLIEAENRNLPAELATFTYASQLPEDSIFFIENSEREALFPLALCSLESAALHNPSKAVLLLRTARSGPSQPQDVFRLLQHEYPNIFFRSMNPDRLVLETPVASLWNSRKIEKSRYGLSHTSDVLRVAILYKFGGTYVDTDIITLRIHPNDSNYVNFEEKGSINGAMMKFSKKNPVLDVIGQRLAQYFNPRKWASNGPRLLSAALASQCDLSPEEFAQALSLGPGNQCGNIRSFGPQAVFAIHYNNWKWFFQPQKKAAVMDALGSSFATHLWGHFFKQEIQWDLMRPDQAFHDIAAQHCPTVFSAMTRDKS